jgi:hypothetical protein
MTDKAPEEEELSFELGDRIIISGGRYDGLRGRIYYIDVESLIRVLPDGVSDRLIDLQIIDGDFDPELGVEQPFLITKRVNPAFVAQIDAHVGQKAETFSANGEPGPSYMIKSVDEKADTLLLEDETGAEVLLECNFIGIPLDEEFAVIRTRDLRTDTGNDEENAENALTDEQEEEEDTFNDVFEDILDDELEKDKEQAFVIQEIPAAQRFYPDLVQRNDMLQDFVLSLSPAAQKNPEEHKKIRTFVEQCISLRNSLVVYSKSGEPIGTRNTSYSTLSDLLDDAPSIPLSRYILGAKRVLNLDHTQEEVQEQKLNGATNDTTENEGVVIKYLNTVINGTVDYMDTQLGGIQAGTDTAHTLPNWFLSWETLNRQYNSVWTSGGDIDIVQFKADKEFFRGLPDLDAPGIDGLPVLQADKDVIVTPDLVTKISMSMLRGLGPRYTRLRQKDTEERRIESGESGESTGTLLFPISEQRDLGAIRSGIVALDIAHSQQDPQTMRTILERLEGIPSEATAGGILSVGLTGNTNGNIPLEEWMRALPIHPLGLGDVPQSLANYGLSQKEYNVDQQDVLVEKIQMMRALIKQYILEVRGASTKAASEHTVVDSPFLSEEAFAACLEALEKEPILASNISDLAALSPLYKGSDIATFAYLLSVAPDLLIKTLAQIPGPLAVERNRRVREQFLDALRNALARAQNRLNSGEEPVPNKCPHVSSLASIYRVKDLGQRMQLFAKFLTKFQGGRKTNWIECAACKQHLVCYHEVLLLQEFLHPREKDALHKELLLKFSAGQFNGNYMCGNCGQPISEIEFDTNMEYTDSGAPMSGRAVLEVDDEIDGIDLALGPAESDMGLKFTTETQKLVYNAARKLFDTVGIIVVQEAYIQIVQRVESEILKQPSRKEYPKAIDGKRTLDYDIHINRILVGSVAVNCLLEVQTNIPGYVMRYRMPGCRAGFTGYPLGNEKEMTGMEYIACAVAAINEPVAPWNLTGFQREAEKKRQESVLALMVKRMAALLTNAGAQQQISMKRAYLKELFGSTVYSEQLPEQIPQRFTPAPYNISDEEVAKSAIVSEAASPTQVARAWILQAHRYGKENGTYLKENLIAEATCCVERIQNPASFWKEKKGSMASIGVKMHPRGPIGSHLGLSFSPRRQTDLEGVISPEIMYKIFLNVCYDGPRKGLPHTPGYTNECSSCGFVYAESPYSMLPFPPLSVDSKTQKELTKAYNEEVAAIITKGKVALDTQGIDVTQETFEEVVDASHKAFHVDPIIPRTPVAGMKLFEKFRTMNPEPFAGWKDAISVTIEALSKLNANDDPIDAYGSISNVAVDIIDECKSRLGEVNALTLQRVLEGNPIQCIEAIRTYFLVPFQRLVSGFHTKSLRVQKSYKLGLGTEQDINKILDGHLEYMAMLAKRASGFTLHKMKWAHARFVDALKILKSSIRSSYIPGGAIGLPFIITALIGGIIVDFMNPNVVPPDMNEEAAATVDTGARAPIQIVDVCLQKMRLEATNFTDEQIREMITRRDTIEKMSFIKRFDDLTPEAKAVEKMKKKLGLGDWAVGGTNVIYAYNPEQYERERGQRTAMGFEDFSAGQVDLEGGQENGQEGGQEDGYDNDQMAEEDY